MKFLFESWAREQRKL